SVGAKQLKKNAVTNPKIKNGAVTGAKVANNSLTGANILESSLDKVPSAANADQATSADSATSATNATRATNATSATNATDADQLGGAPASAFQSRVTGTCSNAQAMYVIQLQGTALCSSGIFPIATTPSADDQTHDIAVPFGVHLGLRVNCHASVLGTIFSFYTTDDTGTLSWLYSDGTTIHVDSAVLTTNVLKEFSFAGKRIEGQFIFTQPSGFVSVTTVKLHAFDGGSFCEVRGTGAYSERP
ncbi:MAG: hypothetical protein WBB76_09960, partial [Gaiellaceae bacterium]